MAALEPIKATATMHPISPISAINVNATLLPSPAFHPHLLLSFQTPDPTCGIHLALMLPDWLFVDPDELADIWGPAEPITPASDVLSSSWSIHPAKVDIERPYRPSSAQHVLELIGRHDVDIPLHARYLPPSAQPQTTLKIFDSTAEALGTSSLKGTLICEGQPSDALLMPISVDPLEIALPNGQSVHKPLITSGTALVVWSCWAWLAYKLFISRRPLDRQRKIQ